MKWVGVIIGLALLAIMVTPASGRVMWDWESREQLEEFISADNTSETFFAYAKDGTTYFNIPAPNACWQAARQLQDRAEVQGKRLTVQIIDYDWYFRLFGKAPTGSTLHAMNIAVVGSDIYFVDALTDRLFLIGGTGQ